MISAAALSGTQNSGTTSALFPVKPGGAMPTTVNGRLLMSTVFPINSGSLPCRFQ